MHSKLHEATSWPSLKQRVGHAATRALLGSTWSAPRLAAAIEALLNEPHLARPVVAELRRVLEEAREPGAEVADLTAERARRGRV